MVGTLEERPARASFHHIFNAVHGTAAVLKHHFPKIIGIAIDRLLQQLFDCSFSLAVLKNVLEARGSLFLEHPNRIKCQPNPAQILHGFLFVIE